MFNCVELHDNNTASSASALIASERINRPVDTSHAIMERIIHSDILYAMGIHQLTFHVWYHGLLRTDFDKPTGGSPGRNHNLLLASECHQFDRYRQLVSGVEFHHRYCTNACCTDIESAAERRWRRFH